MTTYIPYNMLRVYLPPAVLTLFYHKYVELYPSIRKKAIKINFKIIITKSICYIYGIYIMVYILWYTIYYIQVSLFMCCAREVYFFVIYMCCLVSGGIVCVLV